jgi:hypothetical protein
VLYVELMAGRDSEACFECDPEQFREGWSPMIAEAFAQAGEPLPSTPSEFQVLYERSGGRLPARPAEWAEYEGTPYFDDGDAPSCPPHCTEACCRKKAA